jgi:hypothetical protein
MLFESSRLGFSAAGPMVVRTVRLQLFFAQVTDQATLGADFANLKNAPLAGNGHLVIVNLRRCEARLFLFRIAKPKSGPTRAQRREQKQNIHPRHGPLAGD